LKSKKQPQPNDATNRRAGRRLTPEQRWFFRIIALLSPILLLVVVEVFLRISGYGYPTSFFLKQRINGREVLTDNWQFGWRFFSKDIARTPQPVVLSARKTPGTIRIFVFGESAAMGDPEPAFGLPRMLQAMLELKFPSNRFEVINVAMTAINSHVVREIAKDCAPLEGDVWIIYMGNNEVVGPFGGGTVFGRQAPSLLFIRGSLWLKRFRIVQWLGSLGERGPREWEGMEMFLKQQVPRDDPRMKTVRAHFRQNLRDIIGRGQDSGARVILSTVAVNLKDCPPFGSSHSSALTRQEESDWQQSFDRGIAFGRQGDFAASYQVLSNLQRRFPTNTYAALYFRLARLELVLGDLDAAYVHFNVAREHDTLRFRADEQINLAIRNAAADARATFVDAAKAIAARGTNSIPGDESFYEHVHFNFEGNYFLARAFFDEVVAALPAAVTNQAVTGVPSLAECARRLAWTDWERLQVYEEVRKRLQQPPFTAQIGHADRDKEWQRKIDELSASLTPASIQQTVDLYENALRMAPQDWILHENFAKVLEANADSLDTTHAAIQRWQEVARLLPHEMEAQHHLGNLLDTLGRSKDAVRYFRAALTRNPRSVEARNGLALALSNLGNKADAEREFNTALRIKPKFTEARINLGQLFAEQGRTNEAIQQYELALKSDTNSAAAHVNLGKLLNQRGDKSGAMAHYELALRINPKHAVAHYNLGNGLLATQPAEAARHFAEAVRAKPNFAEAHLALALQLAQSGTAKEAEKHFGEAIRLQPDSAVAHFNYGVLLANQKRFTEAEREFSLTLELQPDHQKAREFLERAQRMK
jgi:tetratricopeptide (TPR) repeat protein